MDLRQRLMMSLAGGASLLALAYGNPVAAQQSAQSDQPAASSASGLEEIVVTARRREEKAQSVPIALTNISAFNLESQQITQVADLVKDTPGLTVCCSRTNASQGGWMRGVPGVVGYFADAPASISGAGLYFDMASLQVLKGPQGTLFGIATDGGAIVYQPKAPTNSFEGFVQAELGDYGHYEMQGVLNIPIVDDKVLLRVGGQKAHTDGFVLDLRNKTWAGDESHTLGRVSLTLRPFDNFQNDLVVMNYNEYDHGVPTVLTGVVPSVINSFLPGSNPQQYVLLGSAGWYVTAGTLNAGGTRDSVNQWNIIDTTRFDLNDDMTIKNIVAYQEVGPGSLGANVSELAQMPIPWFSTNASLPNIPSGAAEQATEELQLLGKLFDEHLSYTLGTFMLWTQNQTGPHNVTYTSAFGGVSAQGGYNVNRTNAVYGQGTYDLSQLIDGLSFTGGYRYTWDRVNSHGRGFNAAGIQTSDRSLYGQFHSPSYTLSLDYQIAPQTLLYVTNSKGYSHGGFNAATNVPSNFQAYGPEDLNNVEIGIKTDWDLYGIKARTNVSAFYGFYENVIVPTTIIANNQPLVITLNAAQGHIEGIDSEFTIIPTDDIEFHVNAAFTQDKYDTYLDSVTLVDKHNEPFILAPKWKWNVGGTYHLPVDESLGRVSMSAQFSYASSYLISTAFPVPLDDIGASFHNLDLSMNWTEFLGRSGLDLRAYVTNVLQNHRQDGAGTFSYSNGYIRPIIVAVPRMWGLSMRYAFGE